MAHHSTRNFNFDGSQQMTVAMTRTFTSYIVGGCNSTSLMLLSNESKDLCG